MRYVYHLEASDEQIAALDESTYDFGIDDYIWFEDNSRTIKTENAKVPADLESIFEELEISYTKDEED